MLKVIFCDMGHYWICENFGAGYILGIAGFLAEEKEREKFEEAKKKGKKKTNSGRGTGRGFEQKIEERRW